MAAVTITDRVGPKLRSELSPQRLAAGNAVAGRALAEFVRKHYREKDAKEPNRLGGDRTHFWRKIAESVQPPVVAGGTVSIKIKDRRIGQKVHGGPIVPKRARALTIPIHPAAHGRRAALLAAKVGRLFILRSKSGEAFLAGKIGKRVTLYYLLRRAVNQAPWPGSLPSVRGMKRVFTVALKAYFQRRFATIFPKGRRLR